MSCPWLGLKPDQKTPAQGTPHPVLPGNIAFLRPRPKKEKTVSDKTNIL